MRPVLITGGCGFIGSNLARRLLLEKREVWLYDNMARRGVEENARGLKARFGSRVRVIRDDVRNAPVLRDAVAGCGAVFHFAAQVAVTTSLGDPQEDFSINAQGTLHLLESLRALPDAPPLLFTSTNKVYGGLPNLDLREDGDSYRPDDPQVHAAGVDESQPLDFCSPYGCSKGAADQYVLEYARTYGLPAVVFRMSCIYGPHQFGTEDQGWVAHFARQALEGRPIVIYGDGKQVRDVLFISDLLDAMQLVESHIDALKGQAFNVGGGPQNALSLRQMLEHLARETEAMPHVQYKPWRVSDQRYYVSNTSRFERITGWAPQVRPAQGIRELCSWFAEGRGMARAGAALPSRQREAS